MNKVIELSMIENKEKKKKVFRDDDTDIILQNYKEKILNDLDEVIVLKYFKGKDIEFIKKTNTFIEIRNKFIVFFNAYIEINLFFKEIKKDEDIIKDIIDNMLDKLVFRAEHINSIKKENIKEINLLKETKEKFTINSISLDF